MANEIDTLMDLDPLELTSTNIDAIIAYHRKARGAGAKPKRDDGPKADISEVLKGMFDIPPAPAAGVRRR
jgi:hypothetical protein